MSLIKNIKPLILLITLVMILTSQTAFAEQPITYNTRLSIGYDGSQANGDSYNPVISNNGRFIIFASNATNLVPNDTNGKTDVFVFDFETAIISSSHGYSLRSE